MSEPILNPGYACAECRRRKTRCDGLRPACGRCLRLRQPCEFVEARQRIPLTSRLQAKIAALESVLEALSRRPTLLSRQLVKQLEQVGQERGRTPKPTCASLPIFPIETVLDPQALQGSITPSELETRYGSSIERSCVEAMFHEWNPNSELPSELHILLIRLFLPFRSQFNCHIVLPLFLDSLRLPAVHPMAIHHCMLNAMYLAACATSGGYLSRFEPIFLSRTRSSLEQSLGFADRLFDFMRASVILTMYYSQAGRVLEGVNTISALVGMALGHGLHQGHSEISLGIQGLHSSSDSYGSERLHGISRSNLWCDIYLTDVILCSEYGVMSTVKEEVRYLQTCSRVADLRSLPEHSTNFTDSPIGTNRCLFERSSAIVEPAYTNLRDPAPGFQWFQW
ncbi:uncharacterized protein EI90DRAFT_1711242 [Cantharellus anzutake]|uniref:uncharacterized protein n=1 Tax=Cantharellus anzutake TaxID=1750568 RepID=UPI0019066E59|nr:uncharacterized protein EI90DRAFT_1711242 [Cantharellus anzutake]KAF8341272.1 hypothetical protein EI90DRAFT_1711242 [Cantharellus anzutake]